MRNHTEEIRAALAAEHPGWDVWVVWRVVGGPLWCARRRDCSGPPISFGDPDTLAWEIEQAGER